MKSVERIVIVGAGGFGREIVSWAFDCQSAGTIGRVAGFIDDSTEALPGFDLPYLGPVRDYQPLEEDRFLIAIGRPEAKRRIVEALQARGGLFATMVHPTAIVARTAIVEDGVILCPYTMVNPNAAARRFVTIISFSGMGHDSEAGAFSTISSHVDITGHVRLGSEVFVGSGARVLPGIQVGDRAVVGAGAVVMRRVKPGATVYGAPARVLARRDDEQANADLSPSTPDNYREKL